jgi:hypothetical protein
MALSIASEQRIHHRGAQRATEGEGGLSGENPLIPAALKLIAES